MLVLLQVSHLRADCVSGSTVDLRSSYICMNPCSVRWIPPVLFTNSTGCKKSQRSTQVLHYTHTHIDTYYYLLKTQQIFGWTLVIIGGVLTGFVYYCVCAELRHVPKELFAADPTHSSSLEVSYRCRKCR